jgi:hypothetical protein
MAEETADMKVRSDFVSNSSSCSFVIRDNAAQAAKMFLEDFGGYLNSGWNTMGDSMNISFKLANEPEDAWCTWQSPSQFVCSFSGSSPEDGIEGRDPSSIDELSFECDDYDSSSMSYLVLLHQYFSKFGFKPDASESEKDFLDGEESFLGKIFKRLEFNDKSASTSFSIGERQ